MSFSAPKHTTQDLLYLVPLSLFFLLYKLGSGSLASWDEAIYASVAKEVAAGGDWLTLHLNGQPWLEKPPLAIWATALFYQLFGVSEFAARLFSALCGFGCVLATYVLGGRLFDRRTGFIGALVLLSTSDFLRYARFGMLEAPLLLSLTLCLLFFWMGQGRNRYLIFSGVALGAAILIKGFAAFLVFPVIWTYALFSRRLDVLWRSSYWIGVMIAAAMALPWHLTQLLLHRGIVDTGAFSWDSFVRPFQALDAPGSLWYYYVRVLVNKFHPWILIAIVTAPWFLFKALKDRDDESVFLASWLFVIFSILTLFHLKRLWYILPVYPALALSAGYALSKLFARRSAHFLRALFLIVLALHVPYSHVFDHDYSPAIKAMAPEANAVLPADASLVLYNFHESPAVSFYMGRASVYADSPESLVEKLRTGSSYLIVRKQDMSEKSVSAAILKHHLAPSLSHGDLTLFIKKT